MGQHGWVRVHAHGFACMHMRACTHSRIHACTWAGMHAHMYACKTGHTDTWTHACRCVDVWMDPCMHARTHAQHARTARTACMAHTTCTLACTHARTHVCACTHTCMHASPHTHVHSFEPITHSESPLGRIHRHIHKLLSDLARVDFGCGDACMFDELVSAPLLLDPSHRRSLLLCIALLYTRSFECCNSLWSVQVGLTVNDHCRRDPSCCRSGTHAHTHTWIGGCTDTRTHGHVRDHACKHAHRYEQEARSLFAGWKVAVKTSAFLVAVDETRVAFDRATCILTNHDMPHGTLSTTQH